MSENEKIKQFSHVKSVAQETKEHNFQRIFQDRGRSPAKSELENKCRQKENNTPP